MSACVRGAQATLCAASVFLLCARAAHAQGADALPTLDEQPIVAPDTTLPSDASAPLPVTVLKSPEQKARHPEYGPIRARRRLALLGEVGWNGIAGFGPNLVYHVDPHFSVDMGAGLSLLGWKVGLRGRFNLLTGPVTPFVGVGFMGGGGFGDSPIPINEEESSRETVNVKIRPSAWLQTVVGVDWIAPSGFNLVGAGGYAFLLSHDPVQVVTGTPNSEDERAFDVAFRSNVVLTIALGYSFR
ncbi:MAG: hypothetical protein ABIQ16_01305 [Polyangiaceae bacterium]